jgi:cytochrome b
MSAGRTDAAEGSRLVWDLPVRVGHWALVAGVAGAWATHYAGAAWFPWHRRCGYLVLVLALFRILWGFVGTRHARFSSFVRGPRRILGYLRAKGTAVTVGHNPLGALSIVAMLALLAAQGLTGLFANDEIASAGPLLGWVSQSRSDRLTSLHHLNASGLAILIGLHLAAVLWYVLVRGRPLVKAMVTGRRAAGHVPPAEEIRSSRNLLAAAIVVALAIVLALVVRAAPEASISLY